MNKPTEFRRSVCRHRKSPRGRRLDRDTVARIAQRSSAIHSATCRSHRTLDWNDQPDRTRAVDAVLAFAAIAGRSAKRAGVVVSVLPKAIRNPGILSAAINAGGYECPEFGVVQELLSPDSASAIEIYEVALEPGGSSGPEAYAHEGEKLGLVIEGELQLLIGNEVHSLECGDSFHFPSTQPHRFANQGAGPARFVWIVAHPKRKR